ncbi:glycosyltransferase [Salisaeta longa]|uniref:glycosyltransferase n=1 Tax=Salisaeta longa TaxID=503170 RepID=UPI00058D9203|nr:glycosyltransferase [Salisaeta longa]
MPNVSRAFGGPTESLIGYAQAAHHAGIAVDVAAPAPPDDLAWLQAQVPFASFHFFRGWGRHAYAIAPGLWSFVWERGAAYDVVHTHGLFNPVSSLAARVSTARGYPTVMRPFGTLSRYTFSRRALLKRLYFYTVDRPALQAAAALHFTTAAEKDEAARLPLDTVSSRGHVVPPPWRGTRASEPSTAKASRPTVLFLSRLHPKKNIEGLLEAWRQVVQACPTAHLQIAGTGAEPYVAARKKQARTLGIDASVTFCGFLTGADKAAALARAWVFVLPSHQENFGIAVLEAVAAGLPVVISPEVQLASFVQQHDLGRVTDRSPDAIAAALTTLLQDRERRASIAARTSDAVAATFGRSVVGQQLRQMYESTAQQV